MTAIKNVLNGLFLFVCFCGNTFNKKKRLWCKNVLCSQGTPTKGLEKVPKFTYLPEKKCVLACFFYYKCLAEMLRLDDFLDMSWRQHQNFRRHWFYLLARASPSVWAALLLKTILFHLRSHYVCEDFWQLRSSFIYMTDII